MTHGPPIWYINYLKFGILITEYLDSHVGNVARLKVK